MAKNLILWLIIAAVLLTVFQNFNPQSSQDNLTYSDFIREVQSDRVSDVTIDGLMIQGVRQDGTRFETVRPQLLDDKLMADLLNHNVVVQGQKPEQASLW